MTRAVISILLSSLLSARAWVGPTQAKDPWKHYYKHQEKQAKAYHKFQRNQSKELSKYERRQALDWDRYERGAYQSGW